LRPAIKPSETAVHPHGGFFRFWEEHMAFSIRNLSVLAYANGFTLWHYKGAPSDSIEAVTSRGFFEQAADMLAGGDIVMISVPAGARIMSVGTAENERVLLPLL
jgi:hypothetical protein